MVIQGSRLTRSQTARSTNTAQTGQVLDSEAKLIRSAVQTCDQAFDNSCDTKPSGVLSTSPQISDRDDLWLYSVAGNSYTGGTHLKTRVLR